MGKDQIAYYVGQPHTKLQCQQTPPLAAQMRALHRAHIGSDIKIE